MSTQTIEQLQAIVADENRTVEEREAAAKHILTLQGKPVEEIAPGSTQDVIAKLKAAFDKLIEEDATRDYDAEERVRIAETELTRPQPQPEPSPARIPSQQVKNAIRYCEIKEATLSRELEDMKAQSGAEQTPAVVPWFQTPEYLQEKRQREERAALASA